MSDHQPSFGVALVAVLAGGVVSSWIAALFLGFDTASSPEAWAIVSSLAGGVAVKAAMRLLHYDVPFAFAAGALLAGRVASLALVQAMPDLGGHTLPVLPTYGLFSSFPSLVLSAFLVQISAGRGRAITY
jgi:hypothetical protein